MKKPAETVTLRAQEGEAMIARRSVSAPSRADCERLIHGVRGYFWLGWTGQEAKLRLKTLRTLLGGRGAKPPTPSAPEASSVSAPAPGDGEATGAASARHEDVGPSEAAGAPSGAMESGLASRPQATGGQRPGPGGRGAEASEGAERVACRQEA